MSGPEMMYPSVDEDHHQNGGDDDAPPAKRQRANSNSIGNHIPNRNNEKEAGALVEYINSSTSNIRSSSLSASDTLQLTGHEGSVYSVEYSPSGNVLCSASFDMTCLLWSHNEDYRNYQVLEGHKNAVLDCKWLSSISSSNNDDSGGDEAVVTCGADKTVQLWDCQTGQRVKKWKDHTGIVNALATNRLQRIVSASDDGTCRLWDTRSKRPMVTLSTDFPILGVALGEEHVYTGGIDNLIHCWDLKMARKVYSLKGHTDTITCLSLHPESTHLLSNSMDQSLRTWDVRPFCVSNKRHCKTFTGHKHNAEKGLLKCSWSGDGAMVSCGSADRMVHIWDEFSTQELYLLPGHKGCVNAVSFHPKENIIVSGASDKQIFVGELS